MIGKINALELLKLSKEDNRLYELYKRNLARVVRESLSSGLSQFVLYADDFKEVLHEYSKRSLYKIDLIEFLEEWTFKGLRDVFNGRFVTEVNLFSEDAITYKNTCVFVHLLDAIANDNNKDYLEKRYKELSEKYK